jgi:hypothetical protein
MSCSSWEIGCPTRWKMTSFRRNELFGIFINFEVFVSLVREWRGEILCILPIRLTSLLSKRGVIHFVITYIVFLLRSSILFLLDSSYLFKPSIQRTGGYLLILIIDILTTGLLPFFLQNSRNRILIIFDGFGVNLFSFPYLLIRTTSSKELIVERGGFELRMDLVRLVDLTLNKWVLSNEY